MAKSKANTTRKQALLAEALPEPVHENHLARLLVAYASGEPVRAQVADNIVGEFRPVLRAHDGPNYDGPLYARIMEASEAAEAYGKVKIKGKVKRRAKPV